MTKTYDAIIIGAGHNGLVCAFYLAQAGLKVRMVERRGVVGGAAVTEEFHPGFRNSVASYTVSLLQPKVIRDMRLVEHGYKVIERPISNFLPQEDGRYRSEENTSELQSLMRHSYAVFRLKKKNKKRTREKGIVKIYTIEKHIKKQIRNNIQYLIELLTTLTKHTPHTELNPGKPL